MIKIFFINLFLIFFLTKSFLYSIEPPKTLVIVDLEKSESNLEVEINDSLFVHYNGWLFDESVDTDNYCDAKGNKFDSSIEKPFRNEPQLFKFKIGKGLVIPGWELGLLKMKKGSKRCLVIPYQLAYGHRKIADVIPAYSNLIFEIKLVDIYKSK